MPDGLRAAAAGLAAQQARLDAIANDVANVGTTGYKHTRVAFRDLVGGAGAAASDAGRSFQAGPLVASDNPLSVAITGPGFLQVTLPDGRTGLTRAGDLRLDANRDLTTASGLRLSPPIKLPAGADPDQITISADGTVSAGATKLGQLQIVDVPARSGLLSAGDGVYVATAASGAAARVAKPQLQQRALEGSNVDVGTAMVDMIDAQRSFQLASQALKMQDQLLDIANQIKR
jgi:flagellar basal-body rod protein FlgG